MSDAARMAKAMTDVMYGDFLIGAGLDPDTEAEGTTVSGFLPYFPQLEPALGGRSMNESSTAPRRARTT